MIRFATCLTLLIVTILLPKASAQQRTVDLLATVDPARTASGGQWQRDGSSLIAEADGLAKCVIPYELTGNYQVVFEFTREQGNDTVGLILPLGQTQVLLELSAWDGAAHGFSRINEAPVKSPENPASVRPGRLINDQRCRVDANVNASGDDDQVTLQLKLNGELLVDWTGAFAAIQPNIAINLRQNNRLALCVSRSRVTFHSLAVTQVEGRRTMNDSTDASLVRMPSAGGEINLTDVAWNTDVDASLSIVRFEGERVILLRGADGAVDGGVALLPQSDMGDGEIKVDIASDTFSGIAFRAADSERFDMIYFRPQNSRTAKHENTVQYVSKGVAGADWRSLRERFPGKYEAGADVKPNDWFQVTIVLSGSSATAYVDDRKEPVLKVDQLLGGRSSGAFGLWGWNTRFRNFSFKPKQ